MKNEITAALVQLEGRKKEAQAQIDTLRESIDRNEYNASRDISLQALACAVHRRETYRDCINVVRSALDGHEK